MPGVIKEVIKGSIAQELAIEQGDQLLSINGVRVLDIIDYRFYSADEEIELEIRKADGEIWEITVEKDVDEDLGLTFSTLVFDGVRTCTNNCLFCFMDQLHPDARPTLLLKDDDYRLSFLEGNFITGTNLTENDLQRIERLHLSPLYFSVQATDPELRSRLLGNPYAEDIMPLLKRLTAKNIFVHTQIVLCPGINDGEELERSLDDLAELYPQLLSVSLVPVGLTRYQKNKALRLYTKEEAANLITYIEKKQAALKKAGKDNYLFLADEFYLLAEKDFPSYEHYGDYSQFENGVGMSRLFLHEWQELRGKIPSVLEIPGSYLILSGKSGAKVLQPVIADMVKVRGLDVELLGIENVFFGDTVTVSGLLTATCVRQALEGKKGLPCLLLPTNMLKFNDDLFLDGLTVKDLSNAVAAEIRLIEPDAKSLFSAIFTQTEF